MMWQKPVCNSPAKTLHAWVSPLANCIDTSAPAVNDLTAEQQALAEKIAAALSVAEKPLVVSGTGCASVAIMQAAANIATALHNKVCAAELALCQPEVNSIGVAMLGGDSVEKRSACWKAVKLMVWSVIENDICRRAAMPSALKPHWPKPKYWW